MIRLVGHFAVLVGWALFAAISQAQVPGAFGRPGGGFGQPAGFGQGAGRPALSPYLNLLRGGNPALNYYGLVRPQIAAEKAFQTLGSNIIDLETSASNQPVQTGIRASFMTHKGYFMNNGAGGVSGRAPTISTGGAPPPSRGGR